MKKIFLILVVLAGFTAEAAIVVNRKAQDLTVVLQEKQYKKIEVAQVSKDALDKIKKSYGNYTIKEAHKADDGEYKLVLSKDGTDITATFTPAGDLIKIY